MFTRWCKAAAGLVAHVASVLWSEREEIGTLASTALVCAGVWQVYSLGSALIVAGVVGLWLHLPARRFVKRVEKGREA